MLKIWYRYIQKRPEVGFPYLGSWTFNNPRDPLSGAIMALKADPERAVAIERIDSKGRLTHYGWTSEWRQLLEAYPRSNNVVLEREWRMLADKAFEAHRNTLTTLTTSTTD